MNSTQHFPSDYFDSRDRFRTAAASLGWAVESHPIERKGPKGEQLTIDVAISPAANPSSCLILSSGLHGIEGFFGAAVQLGLFESWANKSNPPESVRCVMIHGLNPYGYAWLRRFNEDNIDLNRNFLLEDQTGETPEGYAALDTFLNPECPPSRWEPFLPKAILAILRAGGKSAVKQAVAGGQYDYPKGLFYGGKAAARTQMILKEHLPRWASGCGRVVHLDFHTGLGKGGTWKLLIDYSPNKRQFDMLEKYFGAQSFQINDPKSIAYKVTGGLGAWSVKQDPLIDYLYACAEFGTYNDIRVLSAIRAENQAHHWGELAATSSQWAKRQLMEVFCPASEAWRQRVLDESLSLVHQALAGLNSEPMQPI